MGGLGEQVLQPDDVVVVAAAVAVLAEVVV